MIEDENDDIVPDTEKNSEMSDEDYDKFHKETLNLISDYRDYLVGYAEILEDDFREKEFNNPGVKLDYSVYNYTVEVIQICEFVAEKDNSLAIDFCMNCISEDEGFVDYWKCYHPGETLPNILVSSGDDDDNEDDTEIN